jgi:RimJ/RimL family protein N-acetyltransferase
MTTQTRRRYEFRVSGHLDPHWCGWLGDLEVTHHDDGTSTLDGPVTDQAQLHGLLAGLRDIGATLLSLRTVEPREFTPAVGLQRLRWPARTDRLTLRPARREDAEPTWRYRRLESVSRWITHGPTSLSTYAIRFETPGRLASTLIVERDGQVIGDTMLRVENAWAQDEMTEHARGVHAELGWVLDPAHTGHGYATEAVRELLRLSFDELRLRRVVATCFAGNESSWRLMERVGMRREQHAVSESLHRSGEWMDIYGYAMLAIEWSGETAG